MTEFVLTGGRGPFSAYVNPAEGARAALAVIHGVGEHFTRYQELADTLAERGYAVYGLDLYGHGTSPGVRGDVGSREDFCSQIDALITCAEGELPGKPLLLMGHSMGGLLVLYYRLMHRDPRITGYITSSPWLGLTHTYTEADIRRFQAMVAEDPDVLHDTDISPRKLFTKEPGRVIQRDPTMHPYIAYRNLLERLEDIETVMASADRVDTPLYIFMGSDDPICAPDRSLTFARDSGNCCVTRLWEGLKHEPWNEPCRRQVLGEMMDWMDRLLAANRLIAEAGIGEASGREYGWLTADEVKENLRQSEWYNG